MVYKTMTKLTEIQWSSPKKAPTQMIGWKDGNTLFDRTLPAAAISRTSTTTVDSHLKIKKKEYNVGLTKNYCITVSVQKICTIHKLTLNIQQVLGYYELNDHTHFWSQPSKNHWNNFFFELGPSSIHSWGTVNFRV